MTTPAAMIQPWGAIRSSDGRGRPFKPDTTSPRQVIAEVLARRDGWAEISPKHWRDAAAILTALKAKHMINSGGPTQ